MIGPILMWTSIARYGAYEGGVYSPTQDRVYFVPSRQAPEPVWHYVDGATGEVVGYQHMATVRCHM